MLSAIRHDLGALASRRVIDTLRRWQDGLEDADPRVQRDAKRGLEAVAQALLREPHQRLSFELIDTLTPDDATQDGDGTVDAFLLPKKPALRREAPKEPSVVIADDAILAVADSDTDARLRAVAKPSTGVSAPPSAEFGEEEQPTRAFVRPEAEEARPKIEVRRAPLPPVLDATNSEARQEATELGSRAVHLPPIADLIEPDAPEPTVMAGAPPPPTLSDPDRTYLLSPQESPGLSSLRRRSVTTPPSSEPKDLSQGLAPKPGVIRRRVTAPKSAQRPRAAMQHVRMLHGTLLPFAEELIPLAVERRSRRFWARWREVAGDRGVRRDFIEDLLKSAHDVRTLVCELIAEVQSVDPASVYVLVDRLAGEAPVASERRPSAVQVDGVEPDEA